MQRRLLTILLAAVLLLGLPAFAQADGDTGGGANTAIAINKKDGNTVVKTALAVRHVMGDTVDQTNAAVAFASCSNCSTAAIAVEIVLAENNPSVVTPKNVALAINEQCSSCVTVANAVQFVTSTNGPAHFDQGGQDELGQIRDELHQIRDDFNAGNLTIAELQSRIEGIRATIKDILANHLVTVGKDVDTESDHAAATTPDTTNSSATPGSPVDALTTEATSSP